VATSITTQADVLTYASITYNDLSRPTTDRMDKDNLAALHEKAWTLVKNKLLKRTPPIKEADLTTPAELTETTVYAVLCLAYEQAALSDEDKRYKKFWCRKYHKAFAEVELTVNGTPVGRESFSGRRSLRA